MASIRKRGDSYLIVVSMGYDYNGNRRKSLQKTVHPPAKLTPKQKEKWLEEQAILFEMECKNGSLPVDKSITLEKYVALWLENIAPNKLAKSTLARDKQDIDRFLPHLGSYKLTELRPEHFRKYYAELRKVKNSITGKPLSECTVEGVHACICGILSDAMEGGYLDHNPAWRTFKYTGKKKEKIIADEETVRLVVMALEQESISAEVFEKWISEVKAWAKENDRYEVALQIVGNGLSYAEKDSADMIADVIMKALNAADNEEMRKGYELGIINQRGVHWVDPEGKEEKALAEKFFAQAANVEERGYTRFAEVFKSLGERYLYEADCNARRIDELTGKPEYDD